MLRKISAICERLFGMSDDSSRLFPIPEHDPAIYVSRYRADVYQEQLQACLERLRIGYDVAEDLRCEGLLRPFESGTTLLLVHSYRLRHEQRQCFWITFAFSETMTDGTSPHETDTIRQGVTVELPFDAGDVHIRPENVQDKIAELFGPIDIDFDADSTFSCKYHVLAENEKKVRGYMPRSFMQLLAGEPGLHVRLSGNQALFAQDGRMVVDDALRLANVAFAAAECR